MKAVIKAIRNREMGSYKASRFFSVPQTTLERYVKYQQKSSSETVKTKPGRKQVLRCEVENDLADGKKVNYCIKINVTCTVCDISGIQYMCIIF
jgi:hypothetical protein